MWSRFTGHDALYPQSPEILAMTFSQFLQGLKKNHKEKTSQIPAFHALLSHPFSQWIHGGEESCVIHFYQAKKSVIWKMGLEFILCLSETKEGEKLQVSAATDLWKQRIEMIGLGFSWE